ncbi:MAG: hypothetical protein MUE60_01210 [Candidatus Eisenbacteria bacterium]|jgi:hypothetical protein|nr:hypothetical protein [Candidatus Eisenbacteria bacterium]
MDAPKFQAYLKQQLVFEHQRVGLERSRRNWRVTAVAAMALCALSVARPAISHRARDSFAALLGSPPAATGMQFARSGDSVPLEHTLAASLEQDRRLARQLGARQVYGEMEPERSFVVSRFPISGGRAVSIYTPLGATSENQGNEVSYASDGGVW